jgi:hypothetical protein
MKAGLCISIFVVSVLIDGTGIATEQRAMDDACKKEVIELHQFFEDWNQGKLAKTEEQFRRFSEAVASDFEIISPGGGSLSRAEILGRVREGHGSSRSTDFRIWIENYRGRLISDELVLVTYEEWQSQDGKNIGRVSTAVFRREPDAPNGVLWLHVHETWLPEK